jgi:hypothetical protein
MKRDAALAAIYLFGSALTFGHEGARFDRACNFAPGVPAGMAAAVWPLYWPYRLSWDAFNPPSDKTCPSK